MNKDNKNKRTIDYTAFDFDELRDEIIDNLIETRTFRDINFEASNIRTLIDQWSYIGSHFGYYINSAANEVFSPTAKRYKNINKIGQLLNHDARSVISSKLDVIGNLNPEYVLGKETEYIEIPAYSIFPSTKRTQDNGNFVFTNPFPIVHIVKSFGTRPLDSSDIFYKGFSISGGLVRASNFFVEQINGNVKIDPTEFSIPLKATKQLKVVQRHDDNNFRPLDTENFPLEDPSDNQSVGQPFHKIIRGTEFGSEMVPGTLYYLILSYDVATSSPFIAIEENPSVAMETEENIICTIILEPTDSSEQFFRLRVDSLFTDKRFYVGNTGIQNLDSSSLEFERIPGRPTSVQRIKWHINKSGEQPPVSVLVDGKIFVLGQGEIVSQLFPPNFWDSGISEFNVNLIITDEFNADTNYGAKLEVTSKEPLSNQITIAKISTQYTDPFTGTRTLISPRGQRYGDLQAVQRLPIKKSEQKAGRIFFNIGEVRQRVIFNEPFDFDEDEDVDYHVSLSSTSNIRKWYGNKTEEGFDIYVEPETQFEGNIEWVVTRVVRENIRQIQVKFDQPIPLSVDMEGEQLDYMVQLTPNDNIEVWYENPSPEGFTIRSEREFTGRISWSIYNFFAEEDLPQERESAYRQRGRIKLTPEDVDGIKVNLEVAIPDTRYAIQLVPDRNVTVWYTDKNEEGFNIKMEPGLDEEITVDWYVDSNDGYVNQRHGEISFEGETTFSESIPGFRFVDVPETFQISGLIQGDVKFSHITANSVIDSDNNGLVLSLDPTRIYEEDFRFIVNNEEISSNSIRVFVKNETGNWDEWDRFGPQFNVLGDPGQKVFRIRTNPDRKVTFEFGDGINWGESVVNKEMIVIGLESVGTEGNINKGTLDDKVIISRYIIGNERTDIEFQQNLISLIGLKSDLYFRNGEVSTDILDSEGTRLRQQDLTIVQNKMAVGGQEFETVDEIRKNVSNNFVRQSRNVSTEDYERFANEFFSQFIFRTKVISLEEAKQRGLIPQEDLTKYWYNHVFLIALNRDGSNVITKTLRDSIVNTLNSSSFKTIGTEHEILPAKWVPIDIVVKYKKTPFGSFESVETAIRKNIKDFFNPNNHDLGEVVRHSDIISLVNVEYVEAIEVMINKDPDERFNASDYNPVVRPSGVEEKVAVRNKLMELVAKDNSLIKVFQPLFETVKVDGTSEWNYSLDVRLNDDEFPKLGDIIIKREG